MDDNYEEIKFLQELNHDLYHLTHGEVLELNKNIEVLRYKINVRADKLHKTKEDKDNG